MNAHATTARLHALLDHHAAAAPEYGDGLSSHVPMALHALHELGAGDAALAHCSARAPLPDAADWRYTALRDGCTAALARDGLDATLRNALPALLPGLAAAAFHGAIRTAHAVQAGHRGEQAAALAYWAWRWQPLPRPAAAGPRPLLAPADWLRHLAAAGGLSGSGRLISQRLQAAATSAPYQALAGFLQPAADALTELSAFAALRYAETGNFTVLHMVTGCRALRVLSPWCGDADTALGHAAAAFAAAYLGSGVEPSATIGPRAAQSEPAATVWSDLAAAAVADGDAHVVKLVHACIDWAQHAPQHAAAYRAAAARAVAPHGGRTR